MKLGQQLGMIKSKKYKIRLLGYTVYMIGLNRMNDTLVYYYPEFNNINYLFWSTIIGLLIGFWIMVAYAE